MHIAIGHYSIGASDGVNTVIWRNVQELLSIDPSLHITLFGKAHPAIDNFLPWNEGQLDYVDIPSLAPDFPIPGLEGKSIPHQRVHDYIWHGTNVAETLSEQLADADVILVENLSVGVHPAVAYAFYLWTLWEHRNQTEKRFLVRVHDFAQQRPANFANIKKFQANLPSEMPDWHQILYPCLPNIEYIAINTNDYYRLLDHGIEPTRVWYLPNSIDDALQPAKEPCLPLRKKLVDQKNLDPDADILFYPVRAIPRKNVEEAIFLTQMLNKLAQNVDYQKKYHLDRPFHLVVSLAGGGPDEQRYCNTLQHFVADNRLPVSIDVGDLVALHRKYDPQNPDRILKYGVADLYSLTRMTITTSVLEGFGFVFIEPWVMGKAVIGRNIPSVTLDFTKAGISLGHLYTVLLVNGCDYAELGAEDPDGGLQRRLHEIKKLDNPDYLQLVLSRNSAPLAATLKLFRPERRKNPARNLVVHNRQTVLNHYASRVVVSRLHRIMIGREPTYLVPRHSHRQGPGNPLPSPASP